MQPPSTVNPGNAGRPANSRRRPPSVADDGYRLLVVGASTRAAVHSACHAGCQPLAADLFADLDLRRLVSARRVADYPNGLWEASSRLPAASWMYTGALENFPELVERLEAVRPLLGNSAAVLRRVRDPWLLQETARRAGWQFPQTLPASACPPAGIWLRKPFRSANGSGIEWMAARGTAAGRTPASEAASRAGDRGSETAPDIAPEISTEAAPEAAREAATHYLQEFVPGVSCGAAFVADGRRAVLLGVCRQLVGFRWLAAPPFRYCGSIGPLPLSQRQRQAIRALGQSLAETFELRGLFGVDFILGHGTLHVLEVNPRYTSSLEVLERTWNGSAVRMHLDACQGSHLPSEPEPTSARMWGKAILYARWDTLVPARFCRWADRRNAGRPYPLVADIPTPGQLVRRGAPITTLLADGTDPETVKHRLRRLARCANQLLDVRGRGTSNEGPVRK